MPLPPPVRLTLSVVSLCALAVPLAACGAKDATSTSATATHVNVRQADTSTEAVGEFLDRVHAGIGNAGTVHVVANATGAMSGSAVGDVSYGPDGPLLQMTAH